MAPKSKKTQIQGSRPSTRSQTAAAASKSTTEDPPKAVGSSKKAAEQHVKDAGPSDKEPEEREVDEPEGQEESVENLPAVKSQKDVPELVKESGPAIETPSKELRKEISDIILELTKHGEEGKKMFREIREEMTKKKKPESSQKPEPTQRPEPSQGSAKPKSILKGKYKQIEQTREQHDEFLQRLGYEQAKSRASREMDWSETNENFRQRRYIALLVNGTALSWTQDLNSAILILNCTEKNDGEESPMSAFARNQVMTQHLMGSLAINLWSYGNSDLTVREILVWLIGQIVESENGLDLTLPLDHPDPDLDLIALLDQLLLSVLRHCQVLLVFDGLGYFESEDTSDDETIRVAKNDKAAKANTSKKLEKSDTGQKPEIGIKVTSKEPEPNKKGSSSEKAEPSETVQKAEPSKKSKGKSKMSRKMSNAEAANNLLEKLVKAVIDIAERDLGPGHFPLKLLFINPIRSEIMVAVQEANPDIPVINVPTAEEYRERYPGGFTLPGPGGMQLRP